MSPLGESRTAIPGRVSAVNIGVFAYLPVRPLTIGGVLFPVLRALPSFC
jgi:hypothetical protein